MGFWSDVKSAVSSGYKSFARAVSNVGSTIVKATRAGYDYIKEGAKKAIKAVGKFAGKVARIFNEGYDETRAEVVGEDVAMAEYINELEKQLKNYRERTKGEEQVKQIFRMVREMIGIQYENQGENSLEIFQNYTRHYVSAKFLQDLVSQREEIRSPAEIDLAFLNLIQKFLTNSISNLELEELDKQIQQLYNGKDLLIIGSEALADIWQHQGNSLIKELKALNKQLDSAKIALTTKADRIERKERSEPESITDEERKEVEDLRKSIEALKADISDRKTKEADTTEMKNILNGIHFIFQHENDPRISTAMREEAIEVGADFVEWQDSNVPPAEHKKSRMRRFGLAAQAKMREMGMNETINVE
ncbi:hypothetical protein [Fibrella aquatilis]|uniref:Uncharacterized protein n=1 Tax=Fibrella aquatilis TaxID=2817059 RepID=A0A939JWK8_9BACT|nr:hypothetical protein [Fibrella aquatilis]MBO0932017.1 hypothetical protein [Fibrella aquatilis]